MTDEHEREEEQKATKFKIVDKRRINVDDIDADDVEEETVDAADEPGLDETAEPELKLAGDDEKSSGDTFKPKFAPGVEEPEQAPEMKSDEDPLAFRNIILNIMQTAATVALVDLGLVPHPQTNLVAKKVDEAQKAIGLFELLITNYGDELPENIRSEFQRALADLKAGYVNQM